MSRRERRRAAKLAAARAEEAARLAKQMAEEEKSIDKREREHIDWVKHLTSVPVDPTLLTRQK
jgi:protein subunit release factor B